MFGDMFLDMFGRAEEPTLSQDPNQLGMFCTWKDCTEIAKYSDVMFIPRTSHFDFPIKGFYVKADGRFCKEHVNEMNESVFEVRVWKPQKEVK